ncbi:6-bladed beta-propeller [uncultured Parabacteroides sp.]|uniref:6-bladed beta-propeller n=1 Tax=uncultured Parabacteroides sp. TaxID=512312 RepID=UPI0025960836|nr:6-bladed beta-propeller [uncultured Parabacteroides sp.]
MKYLILISIIWIVDISYAQRSIYLKDAELGQRQVLLSDYASKIENIPLQTTDSCLLSDALSVGCTDKFIFIQDFKNYMFYRFDRSGKFLNKIGRRGNGPFEYSKPFSFKIDTLNDQIYIVDTYKKSILIFSFSGKYIDKINLKYATNGIELLNDNILYYNINYYKKRSTELVLINKNGDFIRETKSNSILTANAVVLELPQFYTFKGDVYYRNQIDNIVYSIDSELNKTPIWKIDCGERDRDITYKINEKEHLKGGVVIKNIKELDKYLFITYYQNGWYNAIYNKMDETIYIIESDNNSVVDDLSGGPCFNIKYGPFTLSELIDNTIVSVLQMSDMSDIKEYESSKFYKDVITSFDVEGNPIVRILTLK